MKYSEEARDLLERYLWETERHLPISKRRDIIKEFKSNLLDMLEERSEDETVTEETAAAVLKEIGSPEHIAGQYGQHEALIPAPMFPLFKMVFSIVAGVLTVLFFVGLFVSIRSGEGVRILESLGSYITSLAGALGMMTLIFYVIQRFNPSVFSSTEAEHWEPKDLPKLEYRKNPGTIEQAFTIAFSLVLILVLTVLRDRLGFSTTLGSASIYVPAFGDRLTALVPLLVGRLVLGIGFSAVLLVKRAWSDRLRIGELVLSFADIVILILFLQGSPDGYIRFDLMEQTEVFSAVAPILRWVFTGVIVLILVMTVAETAKKITGFFVKPASRIEL